MDEQSMISVRRARFINEKKEYLVGYVIVNTYIGFDSELIISTNFFNFRMQPLSPTLKVVNFYGEQK